MSRKIVVILLLMGPFVLVGCSQQKAETDEELAVQFQQLINGFVKEFNAKNSENLSGLYSADAVLYPPNEAPVSGLKAIAEWYKDTYVDAGVTDLVSTVYRVERSGNLAMQLNRWTVKIPQQDGTVLEDRGKTLNVWRLEPDGKWRVIIDAWSSDLPAGQSPITPQ